jgi:broad specificity phosphatase PhoE
VLLYVVRHAAAQVIPDRPSEQWHLSPAGRAAADALAREDVWATLAELYCSAEPKAIATAQRIAAHNALSIAVELALGEVHRPWTDGDYRDAARRYLRGEAIAGWEPREAVTERVRACLNSIVSQHGEADIGIVSHGLAVSLLVSDVLSLDDEATAMLWDGIGFADYAAIDVASRQLRRPFSGR